MKKINVSFLVCVLIFTCAIAAYAGKPPGGNTPDISVTTEIIDSDAGIPYDIMSDLQGSYMHSVDGVISILMANGFNRMAHGDWKLDLGQSPRTVSFTLDDTNDVESGDPGYIKDATLLGNVNDDPLFLLQCTRSLQSMLTMHTGNAIVCPLLIQFSNSPFRLNMKFTVEWPETEKVQIYCNGEDAGGCNEWFITPVPVVNGGRTRARLEEFVITKGNQGVWTNRGAFLLKYRIHVTRP